MRNGITSTDCSGSKMPVVSHATYAEACRPAGSRSRAYALNVVKFTSVAPVNEDDTVLTLSVQMRTRPFAGTPIAVLIVTEPLR